MQLSVIIPTLNESDHLPGLIEQLRSQQDIELDIIIADGGSTDETAAIVRDLALTLVETSAGRGAQMNAGAAVASGELLLFLHADCRLTDKRQLADAIEAIERVGVATHLGHFPLLFFGPDEGLVNLLKYFETKTRMNLPGTFNGDQGLLISKANFDQLGGFWTRLGYLEDQDFAHRAAQLTFITLPHALQTSARRFEEEGARERIILNTLIMGMFHLGRLSFFDEASSIYRAQSQTDQLNLRPFYALVFRHLFRRGVLTGLGRIYRIGRYTVTNFWQLRLYFDLKENNIRAESHYRDHWANTLIQNPAGNIIATLIVTAWFLASWSASVLTDERQR